MASSQASASSGQELTWLERVVTPFAKAIGFTICMPKMRLGRRRHDNHCDECGEFCGQYAMDKLDFPIESLEPDATSSREKLRAMWDAEYARFCLECATEIEEEGEQDE